MAQTLLPKPTQCTFFIGCLLFLSHAFAPFQLNAQKPAGKATYNGIGLNMDKIELLYHEIEYTRTSTSGRTYSGRYAHPQIRINAAEPVDVEVPKLLPYFKECPSAKKELLAYQSTRKKGKEHFVKGFLLGAGTSVVGLIGGVAAGQKNEKLTLPIFAIGFGTGLGLMVNGMIKSHKNLKKSGKHLENSVAFYNQKCYKGAHPSATETTGAATSAPSDTKPPAASPTGIVPKHRDTVLYELLRNDPAGIHQLSLGVHFLDTDIANFHGFNYWLGADLQYQKTAKFGIEALFRTALIDNLSAESSKGEYGVDGNGRHDPGEAVGYKRAREMSVTASFEVFHTNRERKEEVYLGSKKMGGVSVDHKGSVSATQRVSWCLRAGATDFRSVWYNLNGMPFASSPTEWANPETGETIVSSIDLSESMAMVRSTSLTAGISRRVISDLNISLLNNPNWKGHRKNHGFSEIYADVAYAPHITTGKVYTSGIGLSPTLDTDGTPLNRVGWRAGFRNVYEKGLAVGIEVGQRPGPNALSGYLMLSGQYRFGKSLQKL